MPRFLSAFFGKSKSKKLSKSPHAVEEPKVELASIERRPVRPRRPVSEYITDRQPTDSGCDLSPGSSCTASSSSTSSSSATGARRPASLDRSLCDRAVHFEASGPPPIGSRPLRVPALGSQSRSQSLQSHAQLEFDMTKAISITWDVQFAGSFPISNTNPDRVSSCIERFESPATPKNVQLTVSLLGVRVSQQENVLMTHSLTRISSITGKPHLKKVAYIALEPAGQLYRRQCHVFIAADAFQVEEIESVLANAFNASMIRGSLHRQAAPHPQHVSSSNIYDVLCTPARNSVQPLPSVVSTPCFNMPLETRQRVSSSAFLARLLGKSKDTPCGDDAGVKRKRRPVSAVFSSAFQRFSSAALLKDSKRLSTAELARVGATPLRAPYKQMSKVSTATMSTPPQTPAPPPPPPPKQTEPKPPTIIYDEKLKEHIYVVDEELEKNLQKVMYFCRLPTRESLMANLLRQPEGAFIIRYSESRRSLALSIRVSTTHNPSGVSHYLIIRNEHGFRIKFHTPEPYFPSIQSLVTHYSVNEKPLPCRLQFVDWRRADWVERKEAAATSSQSDFEEKRTSKIFECDENRNSCYSDSSSTKTPFLQLNRDHELMWGCSPHRRSRRVIDTRRHSRFIEVEQH